MTPTALESPTANAPETPKCDFRQEVADNIIAMLEKGVAPWQKPWDPSKSALELPHNPTTEKSYRGGNAIHLLAMGLKRGYEDPRWTTYKQAQENDWQVRKGEKGTQIEFWQFPDRQERGGKTKEGKGAEAGSDDERRGLIHRVYTVFNGAQIPTLLAWSESAVIYDIKGENTQGILIVANQLGSFFVTSAEGGLHFR